MKKLMDFLFGRFPKIFNKEGAVCHNLSQNRWNQWKDRYKKGHEYNWKRHKGTRREPPSSLQS